MNESIERATPLRERAATDSAPTRLLATGAVLASLTTLGAVTSCCLLPVALAGLGLSGAWIANVDGLAAYQPIFLALSLGFVVSGFWLVYYRSKAACVAGGACARPGSNRIVKGALWAASAVIAVAMAYPHVQPWLLGA